MDPPVVEATFTSRWKKTTQTFDSYHEIPRYWFLVEALASKCSERSSWLDHVDLHNKSLGYRDINSWSVLRWFVNVSESSDFVSFALPVRARIRVPFLLVGWSEFLGTCIHTYIIWNAVKNTLLLRFACITSLCCCFTRHPAVCVARHLFLRLWLAVILSHAAVTCCIHSFRIRLFLFVPLCVTKQNDRPTCIRDHSLQILWPMPIDSALCPSILAVRVKSCRGSPNHRVTGFAHSFDTWCVHVVVSSCCWNLPFCIVLLRSAFPAKEVGASFWNSF